MKGMGTVLVLGAIAATAALSAVAAPASEGFASEHAVFVMTNDADSNEVVAYERNQNGTLHSPHRYSTGGRGSGGKVDPLSSQRAYISYASREAGYVTGQTLHVNGGMAMI